MNKMAGSKAGIEGEQDGGHQGGRHKVETMAVNGMRHKVDMMASTKTGTQGGYDGRHQDEGQVKHDGGHKDGDTRWT